MTRPAPRRQRTSPPAITLALCLIATAVPASAQTDECTALRAAIDAAGPDPTAAADMRRQRDEIVRTRDDADRTGCGDGLFDASDSPPCRSLARRIGLLQVGLQRMQDQAAGGDAGDDRRRDLQARYDATCTADRTGDRTDDGGTPMTAVPVDPDAPPGPAAKPRVERVLCVRHCDGAYYPLAADVAPDRMADMDRICQAQCPSAPSSAYAGGDDDVSGATATDGSTYSALPTAFNYLKGAVKACACRAPHQSWADALAGAEALLQPHKGDVTVTAELSAAMARPMAVERRAPVPRAAPASSPAPAAPKKGKARAAPVPAPPPALDITREFRGSVPTL